MWEVYKKKVISKLWSSSLHSVSFSGLRRCSHRYAGTHIQEHSSLIRLNTLSSRRNSLSEMYHIRGRVNNFVEWPHSGAAMHCSEYMEPRDGAVSVLLSSQKEEDACLLCIQKECHCCEG
jgi:hypothetical protein